MEKKNLDWGNIGFSYMVTDERYVADYKDGAWGEGRMTIEKQCCCVQVVSLCQRGDCWVIIIQQICHHAATCDSDPAFGVVITFLVWFREIDNP